MLTLTIKLDDYKEDLFQKYIKHPLEKNAHLKKEMVRKQNEKALSSYNEW